MKLKVMKLYLVALLLFVINGCSNQQERPEPEGYFATHIDENGSKLFQYSLDFQTSNNGKRGPKGGGQSGHAGGHVSGSSSRGVSGGMILGSVPGKHSRKTGGASSVGTHKRITNKLENMLEQELKTTGYCREGYRELERMIGNSEAFIRGECNETVTSEIRAVSMEGSW